MRRIFFTINVSVHDNCFDYLSDIVKININEIPKLKNNPNDFEKLRCDAISETIFESEMDMLLGFAVQDSVHLKTLISSLKSKGSSVSRIYFDNGTRRKAAIENYKSKFNIYHSNWMDYTPEFVELQYNMFDEKILEIEHEADRNNIIALSV